MTSHSFFITSLFAFTLVCLSSVSLASGPERVQADELMGMLEGNEKVILIDVRTPAEHYGAHIPGSVLMPLDTLEGVKSLPEGGRIILYCRSGKRSLTAIDILSRKGYKGLVDLDGGIISWTKAGGEIITGTEK